MKSFLEDVFSVAARPGALLTHSDIVGVLPVGGPPSLDPRQGLLSPSLN